MRLIDGFNANFTKNKTTSPPGSIGKPERGRGVMS
jgi:hypothetical protein